MAGFLRIGDALGRYQIVRLLGLGGMGAVYEAVHVVLKKRFAIKTLLPSIAQLPEARARFLREGEAASRINHPNVVAVSDVGVEGETPYLVMELLEGRPLADLLSDRGQLGVAEAVDILLPVISAVSVGHDHGVIHRDLKPNNIFLARSRWGPPIPKVLDFGVSKMKDADGAALTGTLAILGTAAYMSPEQARGARQVDGQSDQYAFGQILYEMLTGTRAHCGDNALEVLHNIASGAVLHPRQLRPDLPEPLVVSLMRMLEMSPADRYPSLRAVGCALLPFASEETRGMMREAFREQSSDATDIEAPVAAPITASTQDQVPAGAPWGRGGTRLLPTPQAQPGTTLGQAASQIGPPARTPGPSKVRRVVAAATVAAVGGAVVILLIATGRKPSRSLPGRQAAASPRAPIMDEASPEARVVPAAVVPAALPKVDDGAAQPFPVDVQPGTPASRPQVRQQLSRAPASPSAVTKTRRLTPATATPKSSGARAVAKRNCDPKFYLDSQGEKHFKPECFFGPGAMRKP